VKARAQLRLFPRGYDEGLWIDLFAGGGGASRGIEAAIGRPVDVALNHDKTAIAVHERNHPNTKHYRENVWNGDRAQRPQTAAGRSRLLVRRLPRADHRRP
jgi:site-specific DNA-cytosine methylase